MRDGRRGRCRPFNCSVDTNIGLELVDIDAVIVSAVVMLEQGLEREGPAEVHLESRQTSPGVTKYNSAEFSLAPVSLRLGPLSLSFSNNSYARTNTQTWTDRRRQTLTGQ